MSTSTDPAASIHLVIWGTDVNVTEAKLKFLDFLQSFVDDLATENEDMEVPSHEPYYIARLEEVGWQSFAVCMFSRMCLCVRRSM